MSLDQQGGVGIDEAKADEFAGRMLGMLNEGALCLMISIGHRTGLFDTLAGLPPSTSVAIAAAAGLHERYVREWLAAMVTGRIILYEPGPARYHLPAEHAAFLTRAASPNNLAVFAQYVPVLGEAEEAVICGFRNGGGVPYEKYPRFHEVMAEDSGQTVLPVLLDRILPLAPGLTRRLREGIRVLDVGCGRGRALILMAERFPASSFTGYELSREAVAGARADAERRGLTNVRFEVRDLSGFEDTAEPAVFELVTSFDAVHDQGRPRSLLRGIHITLKDDGVYLMQDIRASSVLDGNVDHPVAPLLYTISTFHCMPVSLAQGGEGLGTMWGREKAKELLSEAGFSRITIHELEHDFQNDYYVVAK